MRYIDTGAMYRAITLYCIRNGITKNKEVDCQKLAKSLDDITINFENDNYELKFNISGQFNATVSIP